jgi:hypothetical protein
VTSPYRLKLAAAGLGATLLAAADCAQSAMDGYGIREVDPRLGSLIRRYAVSGSSLPIDKRYSELTAEEKAIVIGWYEKVEAGDEPPFPVDGLRPIYDALRKAQANLLVGGELILVADVGADGKPTRVTALGSPSSEMTKFASSVLLLTKFKPAVCGGKPCKMQFPFRFKFHVE